MAKLRLTIGDISVSTDKDTATVSLETGTSTKQDYNLNLEDFKLSKKMYQPIEVLAELNICAATGKGEDWKPIGKKVIDETFKNQKVTLQEVDASDNVLNTIGDDYYVYEAQPCYKPDSMVVTLEIHSPDHLMTLTKGCHAFVAQKLGAQILSEETKKYKLPYDTSTKEEDKKNVAYSTDNMKVLNYIMTDGTQTEHIFPYLVQYNESFYDMLKRTTNRWGEFLFYEDGKLNVGYDASKPVQKASGWHGMKYCKVADPLMSGDTIGSYAPEAAYDANIADSQLRRNPDMLKNLPCCDLDNGLDVWLMKKVAAFFGNTKSIPTFIGSQAAEEAWNLLVAKKNQKTVNDDFDDKYFNKKPVPEQWGVAKFDGETKEAHNPFTELNTTYKTEKYSNVLIKEQYAGDNAIFLDYNTTYPNLKLGQIIKVYDQEYIVVEVNCKTSATRTLSLKDGDVVEDTPNKLSIKDKNVVETITTTLVFGVVATAKNGVKDAKPKKDPNDEKEPTVWELSDKNFYPSMLPTGHVRLAEPQLGKVFDANDPLNQNRVRVIFAWQNIPEDADDEVKALNASPWLVYATSAASKSNGIFGKHYPGDDVIVNFSNGNVENPYVVGGLSLKGNKVPGSLAERDIVLSSPGGHTLRMDDGSGAGLTAFLAGFFLPGYDLLTTFLPITSGVDIFKPDEENKGGLLKNFEGGFQLTDKYGVYTISGSTDGRNVSVKSPWGDVAISAFTGISISAPNGDIEIKGKNVTIEAGNNLELKSGTNVGFKLAQKKDTIPGSVGAFLSDMALAAEKKLLEKVQVIDLSFVRSIVETYMRPIEGALTVKSKRFLKLEAGKGECDYPNEAYKDQATRDKIKADSEADIREGLKVKKGMLEVVEKTGALAKELDSRYRNLYNKCVDLLNAQNTGFNALLAAARVYANGFTTNHDVKICNTYADLQNRLWQMPYSKLSESDLGIQPCYKKDGPNDVTADAEAVYAAEHVATGGNMTENQKKAGIIKRRKTHIAKILKAANELHKAISELQSLKNLNGHDIVKVVGRFWVTDVPDNYKQALKAAFAKDNMDGIFYFQEVINEKKALRAKYGENDLATQRKVLKRKAAIVLIEKLGFKDEWRNPGVTRAQMMAALDNDGTWNAYVSSIVAVPKLSALQFAALTTLIEGAKSMIDLDNITGMHQTRMENKSWGDAKDGGILFNGDGNTYKLGKTISDVEGPARENLKAADSVDDDITNMLTELRQKLNGLN